MTSLLGGSGESSPKRQGLKNGKSLTSNGSPRRKGVQKFDEADKSRFSTSPKEEEIHWRRKSSSPGKKKTKKILIRASDLEAPLTPNQKVKVVKKVKALSLKPTAVTHKESFPQTPKLSKPSISKNVSNNWDDFLESRKDVLIFNENEITNSSSSQPRSGSPDPEVEIQNETNMYKFARECRWDLVLDEISNRPRDANCVGLKDGTTPLHMAVMSRTSSAIRNGLVPGKVPAPFELIEALICAAPEAAIIRCTKNKYTPLAYACFVLDQEYDVDDAVKVIEILLRHAKECINVFTDEGFSPVDVHIVSYSRHHNQREEVISSLGSPSSKVIAKLLDANPGLGEVRAYTNRIKGPIELLYRCNLDFFKEANSCEHDVYNEDGTEEWWAWKWALLLLEKSSSFNNKDIEFNAVHAASRLVGCPIPILNFMIQREPHHLKERDPMGSLYNLPLHTVCSWKSDNEIISGDPHVLSRKSKAIELLLEAYPEASRMTNNFGETPLQLAVETCTPFHGGLEMLARASPKALGFPKQDSTTIGRNPSDASMDESQSSVDSEYTEETIDESIGMPPFLLASIRACVSKTKITRAQLHFSSTPEDIRAQIVKKDLQSIRSIYGLLRMRPSSIQEFLDSL